MTLLGNNKKGRQYIIESSTSLAISDGEWKYIAPNQSPAFYELTKTRSGNAPEDQLYHLKKILQKPGTWLKISLQKLQHLKPCCNRKKKRDI
ncbi:hypothetical protein MKP07_29885 [Niabella hibiscisoli]|nr:hypothetical protein [Niabella hibiscisoli]MCH5720129.1 hypothetical protein [Niabella hibiscisoli]